MSRDLDVLLFGAAGFTGRQTVRHFALHAPPGLRWAVAGRDRTRLETAVAAAPGPSAPVDVVLADSRAPASVDAAVARARVVLSTAGPFALLGDAVVDACVRHRAHYVDITGETPWVRDLVDRHHARASAEGTRIVPCCGFDSVPSDLGTLLAVEGLRELGVPCVSVTAAFRLRGGLNGGTAASAVQLFESGAAGRARDPFLLSPGPHAPEEVARAADPRRPRRSDDGRWLTPWPMGPVNTRVVRRSAALAAELGAPYGPGFVYEEWMSVRSAATAWLLAGGGAATEVALGLRPVRALVRRLLPAPGTGPSDAVIARGSFRVDLVGRGTDGRKVEVRVAGEGDPSNAVTVTCLCEAALALATDADRLPGAPGRGGVLTPASALGPVLVERLRARGMTLGVTRVESSRGSD